MSTDSLLRSGQFYIRNEEKFAGRNLREDLSLNPKSVYCPTDLPEAPLASNLYSIAATHSDLFNPLQWTIEALPNGRYKLFISGAPTGEINKLLYALLIEPERAEEWIVTRAERHSDGHRGQYM